MKRFISFVTYLLLLAGIPFCTFAEDQPERLIIAMINYETGAQNFSIEEAFFKAHPNATIEYRIYSSEQFNGVLMNGQCDFDLALPHIQWNAQCWNAAISKHWIQSA